MTKNEESSNLIITTFMYSLGFNLEFSHTHKIISQIKYFCGKYFKFHRASFFFFFLRNNQCSPQKILRDRKQTVTILIYRIFDNKL